MEKYYTALINGNDIKAETIRLHAKTERGAKQEAYKRLGTGFRHHRLYLNLEHYWPDGSFSSSLVATRGLLPSDKWRKVS